MTDDISLKQYDELVQEAITLKRERLAKDAEVKAINERLFEVLNKVHPIMENLGQSNYRTRGGMAIKETRRSIKLPQTQEEKKALFDYLTETGDYWRVVNANSQSLLSLYLKGLDEAVTNGQLFSMPGVAGHTETTMVKIKLEGEKNGNE